MPTEQQYTVYYFPIKGLAEVPRLILEYSGVAYSNQYPKDWPAEKSQTFYGQLPILKCTDKSNGKEFKVAQSSVITRYLAKKHDLYGDAKTLEEQSTLESIHEFFNDVRMNYNRFHYAANESLKAELKNRFFNELLPSYLEIIKKTLKENAKNNCFFGTKTTYVDLISYNIYDVLTSADPDCLATAVEWKSVVDKVYVLQGLKMATALNMSLDEVIKLNRSTSRTNKPRRRSQRGNYNDKMDISNQTRGTEKRLSDKQDRNIVRTVLNKRATPTTTIRFARGGSSAGGSWTHDLYKEQDEDSNGHHSLSARFSSQGSKILVSNLHYEVSVEDLKEIFSKVGAIKKAYVHYDNSGRSLGTANIIFESANDAQLAIQRYDSVPLDGQPMKIEIVLSPQSSSSLPSSYQTKNDERRSRYIGNSRRGSSRGRFRGRRGRRNSRGVVSADQLDAEMEDYMKVDQQ